MSTHDDHTVAPPQALVDLGITLTSTEQRLLDVLRSEPGRTFSRAELMALAMPGTVVLPRTVDVHVKSIRKKLGQLAGAIQTIRLGGYRFVPPMPSQD